MDADIIAARRAAIANDARCVSCGTTRVECDRLRENNNDPTAPEWFGCCAIGTQARPCFHAEDPIAVSLLLDEIQAGHVAPPVETIDPLHDHPRRVTTLWLLGQGEVWRPRGGPMVAIVDMDPGWRHNTAAMLMRQASRLATAEAFSMTMAGRPGGDMACDVFDAELADLHERPQAWLARTPLYRALVADLPKEGGKKRAKLAERARHWSTCPARTGGSDCTCGVEEGRQ